MEFQRSPDDDTTPHTASHHLLQALLDHGVEYLFCNLGTDHAPLIEEMARWREQGRALPQVVLCPHENTALHMAGGYAIATGRGQAVLVHVDAGTANSAMAMHNLFRARVPVLLMAGRAPATTFNQVEGGRDTYVHFVQEPFDQGSVVRPYVKWEYTLPWPSMAAEVIARAHSVMQSDPPGPVYLMLPREMLAAPCPPQELHPFPAASHRPVKAGGAHPAPIQQIAEKLVASEDPLLVTAYAGRHPRTPSLVEALARLVGMRVCEFNSVHLNIRRDSPCFAGYLPGTFAEKADVGLMLDVDVPWVPKTTRVNPNAWWAQMDLDAIKRDMPMWGFATHARIEGDSELLLAQLIDAVKALATPAFEARVAERMRKLEREHAERQRRIDAAAQAPGERGAINPAHLCAAIHRALDSRDTVLNEGIRNTLTVFDQVPRNEPGTLLGLPGGGLGFSAGTALGVKLARPDARVVHFVGDGTFYFSNATSTLAVAREYGLPIFTVVLDNGGWSAVKEATLRMYPKGRAFATDEYASVLPTGMDFAGVAEAAGAHGERLVDPADVEAAVARCIRALDEGRSALLHARIAPL
ncbi:acetolactate synthase-1/2/3 large subunit [Pseudacidovorax intermedius]|uniref:Acetolactate synthase-1/2/3 large subunit n=2 Tax=Pseudacidovorax intermedius TaxID=433924 RepID=A0A370F6C1_9BURK|nr:thiamine pyrophosphate-requiring protein [Pseudacidovorax intermedius]RDI18594.1 acetolactate synthase-1/2/3 large subunit [Pseudacidovorax intermedius]